MPRDIRSREPVFPIAESSSWIRALGRSFRTFQNTSIGGGGGLCGAFTPRGGIGSLIRTRLLGGAIDSRAASTLRRQEWSLGVCTRRPRPGRSYDSPYTRPYQL